VKYIKSERLKKFESELRDLEEWQRLGLVPKKDIDKHQNDIQAIKQKITNEKDKLQSSNNCETDSLGHFLPKQSTRKIHYEGIVPEDIEVVESQNELPCSEFELTAEEDEVENSTFKEIDTEFEPSTESDENELYFSEKSRWNRLKDIDPNNDHW